MVVPRVVLAAIALVFAAGAAAFADGEQVEFGAGAGGSELQSLTPLMDVARGGDGITAGARSFDVGVEEKLSPIFATQHLGHGLLDGAKRRSKLLKREFDLNATERKLELSVSNVHVPIRKGPRLSPEHRFDMDVSRAVMRTENMWALKAISEKGLPTRIRSFTETLQVREKEMPSLLPQRGLSERETPRKKDFDLRADEHIRKGDVVPVEKTVGQSAPKLVAIRDGSGVPQRALDDNESPELVVNENDVPVVKGVDEPELRAQPDRQLKKKKHRGWDEGVPRLVETRGEPVALNVVPEKRKKVKAPVVVAEVPRKIAVEVPREVVVITEVPEVVRAKERSKQNRKPNVAVDAGERVKQNELVSVLPQEVKPVVRSKPAVEVERSNVGGTGIGAVQDRLIDGEGNVSGKMRKGKKRDEVAMAAVPERLGAGDVRWSARQDVPARLNSSGRRSAQKQLPDGANAQIEKMREGEVPKRKNINTNINDISWDQWYETIARLTEPLLMQSVEKHGNPAGKNRISVSVSRDHEVQVKIVTAGDARFDQAVLEAYQQIDGNAALEFPTGSGKKKVSFLVDNEYSSSDGVSGVRTNTIKGESE